MKPLTDTEKKMLDFITDRIRNDGYSPTVRDIRTALGIKSTATVHSYLSKLEEKEALKKAKEEQKAAEKREKAIASGVSSVAKTAAGTIGREVGNTLGKKIGGSFGKRLGGNVGASLGRSILGTFFKLK